MGLPPREGRARRRGAADAALQEARRQRRPAPLLVAAALGEVAAALFYLSRSFDAGPPIRPTSGQLLGVTMPGLTAALDLGAPNSSVCTPLRAAGSPAPCAAPSRQIASHCICAAPRRQIARALRRAVPPDHLRSAPHRAASCRTARRNSACATPARVNS